MEEMEFSGFSPSEGLRLRAAHALERIAERSPLGSLIKARMWREEEFYHCAVALESQSCSFRFCARHRLAPIALDKAELSAIRKLERWCSSRFDITGSLPTRLPLGIT